MKNAVNIYTASKHHYMQKMPL